MKDIFRRRDRARLVGLVDVLPFRRGTKSAISSALIERIMARSLAVYSLIFGAQAIPDALAGESRLTPLAALCIGIGVFGSLIGLVVAGLVDHRARLAAGIMSLVYLVVIAAWPIATVGADHVADVAPWPSPLSTIAFSAAAFAFSRRVALFYIAAVYAVYVTIRHTPSGGGIPLLNSLGEAGYGVLLGVSVLLLLDMFRRAAAEVDDAQAAATKRYAHAVREHRTEVERVQVDSILHDSVLTTFLTAARAYSPDERRFAVAMARHALTEVASAGAMPDTVSDFVALEVLRSRFESACRELGISAGFTTEGLTNYSVPGSVVETFFSAVMQALTNSFQHAGSGAVQRNVHIGWKNSVLTVEVTDDGKGFDTATMTPGRLGVRVSIIERVRNIGGEASIESDPGEGTTVRLRWPS